MAKRSSGAPASCRPQEPTTEDWRRLVQHFGSGGDRQLRLTVELLLRATPSGQVFLAAIREMRPKLRLGRNLDFEEIVDTYEAKDLLDRLITEPRCGADPEFRIWKDIWHDSTVGPSLLYPLVAELADARESRCADEDQKRRLREVRAMVLQEFELERYAEWRTQQTRSDASL